MAAQNLREAWLLILNKKGIYPDAQTVRDVEGELRDYFAHETMKVSLPAAQELREASAMELFEKVFKYIPAFGPRE